MIKMNDSNVFKIYKRIEQLIREYDTVFLAIDGMSAAGKTTFAQEIQQEFGGNIFHMDHFFLQEEQRTEKRLQEVGGNIDYERFKEEVINKLVLRQKILYREYSCKTKKIEFSKFYDVKKLNIIEGTYSTHPYFGDLYHLKVFMSVSESIQVKLIALRNGDEMLNRFINEWIPKENQYFEKFHTRKNSDFELCAVK